MAQEDKNELPIPVGLDDQNKRKTSRHLPNFFRTNSNKKFLGGTMDILTQPGTLTRISSYVGRRDIPNYSFDDTYIQETSTPRQYYQLEPAFVYENDVTGDVHWFGDYLDYMNTLKYFGANVSNHSKFNKQEAYSWDPHIDWDKFTNYREYYWLANGPDPIVIYGELEKTNSEFTVRSEDQGDNVAYIFTPDGLTANPRITLYRGLTYTFKINTPGMPFAIKTRPDPGDSYFYDAGISARNVEQGSFTFQVPYEAPDMLYYIDNKNRDTVGIIDIRDIQESAELDIENEILGKRNFTSSTGVEFINGLKIQFIGQITPKKYLDGYWYVEGVGDRIKLINTKDLEAPATFVQSFDVPFDDQGFDSLPWDNADNYPNTKDYLVINRASRDRNNWARANRWFHRNVLETTATANGVIAELDQVNRANRPIIEFEPDIKLFNHGWKSKTDIDLVDTTTKDVFSIVEGSTGYIIDGEPLLPGYRVLFTGDPDILVKNKIYEVREILNVNVNANENITVVSTAATTNIITVPVTNTLRVGMAVRFSGTVVGGLQAGVTYYITTANFSSTTFSVSLTPNGTLVPLTDSSVLTMKVSNVGSGVTQRKRQLTLQEIADFDAVEGEIVYVTKGRTLKGSSFHYENGEWKMAQKKTKVNQAPLFDLFDENLVSYSDTTTYPFNNFPGNAIFNYKVGTGANDAVLGFPIVYRSISNIGDIEFEFGLQKGSWTFIHNNELETLQSYSAFLRKWTSDDQFVYTNGWTHTDRETEQNVVRILRIETATDLVPIDVYDEASTLYAIEQASLISSGENFYISKTDSYGRELTDDLYWIPFVYKDRYKGAWVDTEIYVQDDIVKYNGLFYTCMVDPIDDIEAKLPTNKDYWSVVYQKNSTTPFKGYTGKGEFTRLGEYYVDDVLPYNNETYIVIKDVVEGIVPTNINYFKKLIKGESYWRGEYSAQTIYNNKSIVSFGLYLYLSMTDGNQGNHPTDMRYWTLLSAGSVYPEYYSTKTFYRPGDIVVKDTRPKLDYRIRVYVNDKKRNDLKLEVIEGMAYINFGTPLSVGDKVVYKIRSISNKNVKGYYEIPVNWQNNPLNDNVDNFTFGEVVDHVKTIIENTAEFSGDYPGISNLANVGRVSQFGRKFMQHTGPLSLSSFLMVDKNVNIMKALRWAAREYSEFKKDILTKAQTTAFDGPINEIVDQLLLFHTQSKYQERSAFYYSDMVPFGAASIREYEVVDYRFPVFVIDSIFNPKTQTKRAILIYVNNNQLLYGKDYEFDTEDAFVKIIAPLVNGDKILIKDYGTTDGCYVPYTPTKLGLYPLYEPTIYIDDTYRQIIKNADGTETSDVASVRVIQGHDGSIIKAFNDYRDDIILEIERRIFNSIRVDYDPNIFNINSIVPGYFRRSDFTKAEINNVLLSEFLRWNSIPKFDFNSPELVVAGESEPRFKFVDGDSFTYNYNKAFAPNSTELLYGYWRGVYKYFFDTDRPHSHPWEIQGFSIKPLWWDDVYGVAPYTSDNKILWDNIENGVIAEPGNRRTNILYARPGLSNYIPVDYQGKLLSPLESGLANNFSKVNAQGRYAFGDQAPIETVWRRSSEYPFAVMMLMCVLRSGEFIGKMWDRFTIKRNIAGQIYSTSTKKKVRPSEIPFANEKQADGSRTITSGLANFVDEYIMIQKSIDHEYYKKVLRNLNVKLRYRLGGFSSKEKIKVLLDSRSPNSSGTIFLPQENYKVFYNKSAPVDTVNYSGVIIEKKSNGYAIDGYDKEKNSFEIFPPRPWAQDAAFNVGGVSEEYVDWTASKYYVRGQIIKFESEFYRSKINHTSSDVFVKDLEKWQKLPGLPLTGGRDAIRRSKFTDKPVRIPYGTIFSDIQSVVDFLLGYQERLKAWGFQFEDYSQDLSLPLNWLTSAKEFMFWTLQKWADGSVITLSPAANRVRFLPTINASVDNLDSDFYEYSIFKADGQPLTSDLTNIYREDNGFEIQPSDVTKDGIFHIRSNLVYQEHVLLFDNISIFGDVIYDVVPGYRQGRLKIVGFKTNNWDGSYYSPGFMYDKADITDWQPNTDYNLGDIVKYKDFYYTSLQKVYGTTDFDYTYWKKLDEEPKSQLVSNFDYRIEQFRDYYSLESSNFNEDEQKLARHLTGYQPRQYLENIVIDDVSQYKFYQGFIREKGTLNSVTKLFDALRASGFSSVDIKEEWAFKVGDFGASDSYTELEFPLDEEKVLNNPQDIVLSIAPDDTLEPTVYNVIRNDVTKKNSDYDANPFKMVALDHDQNDYGIFKYRVAGYVQLEDIQHVVYNEDSLLNYNLTYLNHRDKIWIGNTPNGDWDVLAFFNTRIFITSWERVDNSIRLSCGESPTDIEVGDIIAVRNLYLVDGIYKVQRKWNNVLEVFTFDNFITRDTQDSTTGILFKFESVRYTTAADVSVSRYNDLKIHGEKLWIDKDNQNRWKVLENADVFTEKSINPPSFIKTPDQQYGQEIKISENRRYMAVAAPGVGSGKVVIYTRPNNQTNWVFLQTIAMPNEFSSINFTEQFGYSIDMSPDGLLLVIGAPGVSRVKSAYRGVWNASATYYVGDIVREPSYTDPNNNNLGRLYRAKKQYNGDGSTNAIYSNEYFVLDDEAIYEVYYSGTQSTNDRQGAVFVYLFDQTSRKYYEKDTYVKNNRKIEQILCSYDPVAYEKFGSKVKLVQYGSEYWLFVSSEGYNSNTGRVQIFRRMSDGQWVYNTSQRFLNFANVLAGVSVSNPTVLNHYGYDIDAFHGDDRVVVSSPYRESSEGEAYLFRRVNNIFQLIQVFNSNTMIDGTVVNENNLVSAISQGDLFGYSVAIRGNSLFVSAPNNDTGETNRGVVYHLVVEGSYTSANPYKLKQIITPPSMVQNERFGTKIKVSVDGEILLSSAAGGNVILDTSFDMHSDRLIFTDDSTRNYILDPNSPELIPTTFDAESTKFFDRIPYTGSVYAYNRFDDDFIYGDKLEPSELLRSDDNFGAGLTISGDCIAVGAPKRQTNDARYGIVFIFDYSDKSWSIKESQSEMVDISKFKKSFIYNTAKNELITNLDFVDPAKGAIPKIVEQEIKYQTYYDPAVYEFGDETVRSIDKSAPWTDDHVGEIWWDLSTFKYMWYEQGSTTYRNNNWGQLFPGSSIDIYEWTETPYLPSRYNDLIDTSEGVAAGLSGSPRDIDDFTYSTKIKFDPVSQVTTTMYYYWVQNKVTVPRTATNFRNISAFDISRIIIDPKSLGYQYISVTGKNSLSLINIAPELKDKDVSINVQFYDIDNTDLLVHREYALLAEDDANTIIPAVIENKWFDSLVGYNKRGQPVPDTRLSSRQRYGGANEPRQSWFVNRFEALKQTVEYVNSVLSKNQIVDDVDFTNLLQEDPLPSILSGNFDEVVDILDELRFVGTSKIKTATLLPVVIEGKITNVIITDPGYGYKVSPTIKILGTGTGAVLKANLDTEGKVTSVTIVKSGQEYDSYSIQLIVRNHAVLVKSDEEALGGWSIHDWSGVKKKWNRIRTQAFSVPRYWSFVDWYADGFAADSEISYQVERTVDLNGILAQVGDVVKVANVSGNWLLLQRKFITNSPDFTDDYIVVGKQNATIKFSDRLYNLNKDLGFDTKFSFDLNLYDQTPTRELRIILEAIRDNILVDNLREEYVKLFFNNVHYALHEQLYVDWVFKTSFLKINHNVGTLKQRITFQSDELESYQKYIEEVKPYKSKVREFVSSYNGLDPSYNQVTDFDLFSYYNTSSGQLERTTPLSSNISTYPWKSWLDYYTYELTEIIVYDQGNGYITVPKVQIIGDGVGAKATAYIANSRVYKIVIDNPGTGFTKAPIINISGGNGDDPDNKAKAYATIGNSKVRSLHLGMKYDRTTPYYNVDDFYYTDTFTGTGTQTRFKLTYACDIKKVNINILVNNLEIYGSSYEVSITESVHDTYTALEGYIVFATAPVYGANIVIRYHKNIRLFNASDRINYAYNPKEGMYGKDLGQLMNGVDYGGVQLTSIDFEIGGGWDVLPWDVTSWDNVITTNDDFVIASDGTTRAFELPYVPAVGEIINVYINDVRVDDPYFSQYDGSTLQTNGLREAPLNTIMDSFVGDGINKTIMIPVTYDLLPNDYIVLRKSTSDGTILPTDRSLIDAFISGGDLTYATAKGIAAEEIVVDGDGFVTADTSHGPEELVQGHVVDALEINVYHTPSAGGPNVSVRNYTGDGETVTYDIGQRASTVSGIIVLVNGVILTNVEDSTLSEENQFVINYLDNSITTSTAPAFGDKIAIISIDTAGFDITEKVVFNGDGVTTEFLTSSRYNEGDVSGFVTINGISTAFEIKESNEEYAVQGNVVVQFEVAPAEGDIIQIILFRGTIKKWSEVTTQYIPINLTQYEYELDPLPGNLGPLSATAFVVVDNQFLQAPDYEYYVYDGDPLIITDLRYSPFTLIRGDINVYKNGIILTEVRDWNLDSAQSTVTLSDNVAENGDQIAIEILKNADFRIDNKSWNWDGSTLINPSIIINPARYQLINQKMMRVTTFTNHDIIKIKTINEGFRFNTGYDVQVYDIIQYDILSTAINTSGVFDLPRTVSDTSGVFVALSKHLLSPNVDYVVLDNRRQVKVLLPDILTGSDYIEIITFDDKTIQPSYGFKVFKDMMNRYSYKRLDSSASAELADDFMYFDTKIVVKNGDKLAEPNVLGNAPGIVEIDSERIEYFVKQYNEADDTWTLRQLRRGTFGTGVKNIYPVGTEVIDVGPNQTIPYNDLELKKTFYGDGTSHIFELDFVPTITTVTAPKLTVGERYRIVEVGTTDFTSIGASSNTVGTIFTATATAAGTGKLAISYFNEYGRCDDIEVFVAGRRLNKSSFMVYNQDLGQDSFNGVGDELVQAEFAVDGINHGTTNEPLGFVRLTEAPQAGELIVVIRKIGKLWQRIDENNQLVFSPSDVARFLRAKQVILPK